MSLKASDEDLKGPYGEYNRIIDWCRTHAYESIKGKRLWLARLWHSGAEKAVLGSLCSLMIGRTNTLIGAWNRDGGLGLSIKGPCPRRLLGGTSGPRQESVWCGPQDTHELRKE